MSRCNNWPRELTRFIEAKRHQPFAWGVNDCCLFSCDWLLILTGTDPATVLNMRGNYQTALEATRLLQERGGVAAIAREYCASQKWPEVRPIAAGRGDILLMNNLGQDVLGVCIGGRGIFAGQDAMEFFPVDQCSSAWKVF